MNSKHTHKKKGSNTLMYLDENYGNNKKPKVSYGIWPTLFEINKMLHEPSIVEPYNAVLTMFYLCEYANITYIFDNHSLYFICHELLNQQCPTYYDLNWYLSYLMSNVTACLRFPSL